MTPLRIAAFSDGAIGGNPAGVVIADSLPSASEMQRIAAEIGYSETAFAAPQGEQWITRYYAPETEVPFCGHATIALGVALGRAQGAGTYALSLRDADITVEAMQDGDHWSAALASPPTRSAPLDPDIRAELMALFDLDENDLDPRLPPRHAHAGADHAIFALRDRDRLAQMAYDFDAGRALMQKAGLVTVTLLWIEGPSTFVSRNAFAVGGVVEDPATGAAAAALGGALVDLDWDGLAAGGTFTVRQGEDMGQPSVLHVTVSGQPGASVRVAGRAHTIA